MSLGQIIRKKRVELGLTLDEVSAHTGYSKPYLSTIETDKVRNPPSDTLLGKLEDVLKFEIGLLRHIAHVERMPPDVRQDYETMDAENKRYRQIIHNIVHYKTPVDEVESMLRKDRLDVAMERTSEKLRPGQLVPVINRASAGYPVDFDDMGYPVGCADDYVRCPDMHDANMFAVRVVGDSMEPKFLERDIVVFSPAAEVRNGDDCFVRLKEPHESTFKRVFFEEGGKVRLQPLNQKYPPIMIDADRIDGIYRAVIRYQRL